MGRQAIINGFMAGELSPLMDMRSDLKGTKYGIRQATNFMPVSQGPLSTRWSTEVLHSFTDSDYASNFYPIIPLRDYTVGENLVVVFSPNSELIQVYKGGKTSSSTEYFAYGWSLQNIITNYAGMTPSYLMDSTIIQPPGLSELWIFNRYTPALRLYDSGSAWTLAAITFTAAPSEWTGTVQNRAACFFQNRLYVSGERATAHIITASKVGDFDNFTIGSNPDDAFEYELSDASKIQWMQGAKNLIIGTDQAEYIVSAQEGVIMPGDVQVTKQSNYGSALGMVTPIGNGVLYRSVSRKRLRYMSFEWEQDQWVSRDLFWNSEHLLQTDTLRQVTYHQAEEAIYCKTKEGLILRSPYNINEDIVGWSVIETGSEGFRAVASCVDNNGYSMLFTITRSESNSFHVLVFRDFNLSMDNVVAFYDYGQGAKTTYANTAFETGDILKLLYTRYYTIINLISIWDGTAATFPTIGSWLSEGATITAVVNWLDVAGSGTGQTAVFLDSTNGDLNSDLEIGVHYILSFVFSPDVDASLQVRIRNWSDSSNYTTVMGTDWSPDAVAGESMRVYFDFIGVASAAVGIKLHLMAYTPTSSIADFRISDISIREGDEIAGEGVETIVVSDPDLVESQVIAINGIIGRPFTATAETLPLNRELPESTHGKSKRWAKAYVRIIDSYPVSINGRSPSNPTSETQDQQVTTLGWDKEATLTLVQDTGYKSVIAGIYGELAEHGL